MTGYPTPTFDNLTLNAPLSVASGGTGGVLPVANGGTGKTNAADVAAAFSLAFYVPTVADLRALTGATSATTVNVANYVTPGDQGGGIFVVNASDTTTADNGGTIIVDAAGRRWYRQYSGAVNVRWFGVKQDGSSDDTSAMISAVAAAIAGNFGLYCEAGTILIGSTLAFPATMPEGFHFECHPDCTLHYTGTGSAVVIDSCYHAKIAFGRITGTGGSAGLHIAPSAIGANGQNVCVVSEFAFNFIAGFSVCLSLDCNGGSISQCNINGVEVNNGSGLAAGTLTSPVGVNVSGASPYIFQGNVIKINYIQPSQGGFTADTTWIGINSGNSGFGPSANNVNRFEFGAIDGASYAHSVGLNESAGQNMYVGPVVDVQTGVQLETTSTGTMLCCQEINVNSGGTRIKDLHAAGTMNSYSLVGPQGFAASAGVINLPNASVIQSGSVVLSASPTTYSFPTPFAAMPFIVGSQANNTGGSALDVVALSATQFAVHGPLSTGINWIAVGPAPLDLS